MLRLSCSGQKPHGDSLERLVGERGFIASDGVFTPSLALVLRDPNYRFLSPFSVSYIFFSLL